MNRSVRMGDMGFEKGIVIQRERWLRAQRSGERACAKNNETSQEKLRSNALVHK